MPGRSDEESSSAYLRGGRIPVPVAVGLNPLLLCCLRVGGWGEDTALVLEAPLLQSPISLFKACQVLGIISCCESLCGGKRGSLQALR